MGVLATFLVAGWVRVWFLMGMKRITLSRCLGWVYPWLMVVVMGCVTVPETGRKQFNMFTPEQEREMGLTSFQEMKQEVPINQNPQINEMVTRVGNRIASVADLPNANWEFVVFESEEANAFCLPGGKVGIYTGILPITKDEAGLATVIGHEVAHAVARHGGERVSQATILQTGGTLLSAAVDEQSPAVQKGVAVAYGLGSNLGILLPYSREQESEADHIGLLYMARAGYNPQEAVEFWQRFSEYGREKGGSPPWFLSTHPVNETRIKNLKSWMPEAMAEYEKAK